VRQARALFRGFVDNIGDVLDRTAWSIRGRIPFTVLYTVRRALPEGAMVILDVGCGTGEPMKQIKPPNSASVGADIYWPSVEKARSAGTHDYFVVCDVRNFPFKPKAFDVVVCLEVLEHLERDEGARFLADLEQIARHRIILSTPIGRYGQREYEGNPYQTHRCIWQPPELRQFGYRVIGHGLRWLNGMAGVQSPLPRILHPLVRLAWVLSGPVARLLPNLAGAIVCIKDVTNARA